MSTFDRFRNIVTDQLGVAEDEVTPDAALVTDLGADSLDMIEIVMAAEEEWGIAIADEDADRLVTVADAVALMDRMIAARRTAATRH